MADLRFTPEAYQAYEDLDKTGDARLLDEVDGALDPLEAGPGNPAARKCAFAGGLWGIPVKGRSDDWVVIWEPDAHDDGLIRVRYIGPDPFA